MKRTSAARPPATICCIRPTRTPKDRCSAPITTHTPGSTGANDNAAAVCILIALAKELQQRKIPATIAFFDGEESGHSGAKLFEDGRKREVSCVVNLDMCGYGDTIAVYARGSENRAGARTFCAKERLDAHHGELVKYMPEGDNVCFTTRRQPVVSIAVMPRWDTKYLTAMAAQGMGLLGRSPEFKMMLGRWKSPPPCTAASAMPSSGSSPRPCRCCMTTCWTP